MAAAPTDEFELQHIQHLNRDVPPTPGLGRGTDGAQPVAASTNVYEDGESFRMHLGPTLAVPSTPKPGVPVGGAQQVPGDPQPGLQPQRILSKLLLNPMYQPNQPQGAAQDGGTIWERLRHRLSLRLIICVVISSVTLVTLMVVVPVLLTHLNYQPGILDSLATTAAGPSITNRAVWQTSSVLTMDKVTFVDVIKPATTAAGHHSTGRTVWQGLRTDKVTSADVIKVNTGPVQSYCSTTGTVHFNTKGASHVITFGGDGPEVEKLQGARGVAVSPDNKIWVVDETKGNLQVYSMGGVRLCQFPPEALGYPSKTPDDVSIGRDGHPWVLMNGLPSSLDSVVQISTDGHITTSFDLPDNVPRAMLRGMALDSRNNHIYVTWASGFTGGVQAFNSDGKLLWGVGPQERLVRPMYAAVDKQGDIFVSDSRSDFIYRYDETGQFVLKFGGPGLSGGQLNRPKGVCVDRSGRIMVVDSANRRVVMYTGRGSYVSHIALSTIYARGVAVGTGGQLVVTNNTAVIVFTHY